VGVAETKHDAVDDEHAVEHVHSRRSRNWLHQPLQVLILREVRIRWRVVSLLLVELVFRVERACKSSADFLPNILRIYSHLNIPKHPVVNRRNSLARQHKHRSRKTNEIKKSKRT